MSKLLNELSLDEYNTLKAIGMLFELFPCATGDYNTDKMIYSAKSIKEMCLKTDCDDCILLSKVCIDTKDDRSPLTWTV